MVFSSLIFVFGFLPIALGLYTVAPSRMRNLVLLLLSLFFYAWGEGALVLLLIASSLVNWLFGQALTLREDRAWRRLWVGLCTRPCDSFHPLVVESVARDVGVAR